MPSQQIFFGNDQRSGEQQLAGASPLAINVLVDGAGAVRRRPGLSLWESFPLVGQPTVEPIIGIASFAGDIYYVDNIRMIFRVGINVGVSSSLFGGGAQAFLLGLTRPVFAETPFRLIIVGGDVPTKVDRDAADQAVFLGGNPPPASQVAALNQRIFLNNLTDTSTIARIDYSRPGAAGNEQWGNLQFKTAEGRPDAIVAMKDNANELWAFGETTLQVFTPDPTGVISPGRSLNRGISAAESALRVDESFAWLDEKRDFVMGDGRSNQVLSASIAGTIDRIETVYDCWGFRVLGDQFGLLCWQFPSDGRTFVMQEGGGWSQWNGWNSTHGFTPFPIHSHYYWPAQNLNLVGLGDGRIAQIDFEANTDLGDTIKAEVQTGFLNHNTDATKKCDMLRLTFKRGHTTSDDAQVLLSWRDNLGAFIGPKVIPLANTSEIFTVELRTLGYYRARQWKVEFTDAADYILARAEEVFTVGGMN